MLPLYRVFAAALYSVLILSAGREALALDAAQAEVETLRRDVDELRARLSAAPAQPASNVVDRILENKYGPNSSVATRAGRLELSGLIQVWFYSIQNDHRGLFDDPNVNSVADTNEARDNDSFRIRRSELKFKLDVHEFVTAAVVIDPAREASSFPAFSANTGLFKRTTNVNVSAVQDGRGSVPRLLKDAMVNVHDWAPHHDVQIGQFKPPFGEEGLRSSGYLDFVERSFIGQFGNARDIGAQVHGTWWDDRVQYWGGIFNGAGNFLLSGGQAQDRSDDNDAKDLAARVLVRPLWKQPLWGTLEIGFSTQFGRHGEAGGSDPIGNPINGLNRERTFAMRHAAWGSYAPLGPLRGLWFRSEWGWLKDRNAPGSVIDLQGNGASGDSTTQTNGNPLSVQGWYIAAGYKLNESRFCDSAPSCLKPFEFAVRYDTFQNVEAADLVLPEHTDVFKTAVWTAGVNYYIRGHNARIQANYNFVDNPDGAAAGGNRVFHNVRNDSFVMNFQVAF